MGLFGRSIPKQAVVIRHRYDPPVPVFLAGTSSAIASGANTALSLTAPTAIAFTAVTAVASGSLVLGLAAPLFPDPATATASGSLSLTTTSAVGSRAAPGWLGIFITDSGATSVPLISGGSVAAGISGALTLRTLGLISGSSRAIGRGTLSLSGPSTLHWVIGNTQARLMVPGATQARLVRLNNTSARILPKAPLP